MFKSGQYKLVSATIAVGTALVLAGCVNSSSTNEVSDTNVKVESAAYNGLWNAKKDISGGVYYPVVGNQTGPYKVNTQVYKNSDISKGEDGLKVSLNHGRTPTENEYKAWDKDVMPDGTGLPVGGGTVADGEALYEAKCVMCHGDFGSGGGGYPALSGGNGYELHKTLTNNRWKDPEAEGPVRVFGSYWPVASTMFWYIRDAMPHTKSKTLTDDETYALTAYMLYINELKVDGETVEDEDFELNQDNFSKIELPNRNGFVPNIDGPTGPEDVRKFYSEASNYGAIRLAKGEEPCMTDCQKTDNVVRVDGGITDFNPPMSVERNLPAKTDDAMHKVSFNAKGAYETNCAMCHGTGVAPAAGDKAGWTPYLAKGMSKVYENGIKGTNMGMPAKGGASISDEEFKQVVDYMLTFK
jgi:cytochrome c5